MSLMIKDKQLQKNKITKKHGKNRKINEYRF